MVQAAQGQGDVRILPAGSAAPDLMLGSTPGNRVHLAELRGQSVVLIFYPADWSPVCGLYEHQDRLDDFSLIEYARALQLDVARVERELAEHVHQSRIRDDFHSGVRSGVNGTPTFFLNGARYEGDWTDEAAFAAALSRS